MKRIAIFLAVTFALTWAYEFGVVYPASSGALTGIPPVATQFITGAAMFFPTIGVLVTRLVTREGFKNSVIKPRGVKKSLPWFAVAWFGPAILSVIGAAVYFLVLPQDFDPSMSAFVASTQQQAAATGSELPADTVTMMLLAQLPFAVFLAPVLNIFTTFGEEWGWRGYLLPHLMEKRSITFSVVVGGIIWGLWHAPITALGHNYGLDYPGWPILGIVAMCCFCVALSCLFSWLTLRAKSCLPAVFAHGAVNSCISAPTMFLVGVANPFVGPTATGIVGGIGFIVVAILCLRALRKRQR